tara:strand:- start:196 stop:582 length:387 start_codon:yes stop_codon:yes gene_type:complete
MKLGNMFSAQVTVGLKSKLSISQSRLRRYITSWPDDIFSIIIALQNDSNMNRYVFQLPNGEGVLEFNLDIEKHELDIHFQDKNHLKFQQKFKRLLNYVYQDIALDKHKKSPVKFASVDEVDSFFQDMS